MQYCQLIYVLIYTFLSTCTHKINMYLLYMYPVLKIALPSRMCVCNNRPLSRYFHIGYDDDDEFDEQV